MRHLIGHKQARVMIAMAILLLNGVGCTSEQGNSAANSPVVQQNKENYNLETTNLVINYDSGQIILTDGDKSNLSVLIEKSGFDASKDQIEIASWSDNMLPDNGSKLSEVDEKLAKQRSAEITGFLKTKFSISKVKTFNMAERSNWLAQVFSTRDAKLKSQFTKKEAAPMSDKNLEIIRANGTKARSVVVISHK